MWDHRGKKQKDKVNERMEEERGDKRGGGGTSQLILNNRKIFKNRDVTFLNA